MLNMTNNQVISHFNKLEGVDRILKDLYNVALVTGRHDSYDPYTQKLLNAILAVTNAQRELPWSPSSDSDHP
jgi:hypothetical protein